MRVLHTTHSSSHHGGSPPPPEQTPWSRHPLGAGTLPGQIPLNFPWDVDLDQIPLNFPLGCGPGPNPPQLPPWVWAWKPPWPDPLKLHPWVWVLKPARHAGIPPPQRLAARHAGIPPPGQNS